MRLKHLCALRSHNRHFLHKITAALLLMSFTLCACEKEPSEANSSEPEQSQSTSTEAESLQDTSTEAESLPVVSTEAVPETLEQALLRQRGIPFDRSDYKKFTGGENIIDINAEFDCILDHGYSTTVNDLVVSGGKLYEANFNTLLANGKNIQEAGTLPGNDVLYWQLSDDLETGSIYLKDGSGYKVSGPPFSTTPLNKDTYPLFKKVYRYSADGKTLEDHTAEFLNADKVCNTYPTLVFVNGKVSMLFSGKYLYDGEAGWNWYRDMGWREYIAFDLDISAIGDETPVRLFNYNILMTDRAFYEIVYASKALDENDAEAQLAPDGSVSPYYPAAAHLNCNLTLRKITLLSDYYNDVRNISTSHVITADFTMLPIGEVITEGYREYSHYNCCSFYQHYYE